MASQRNISVDIMKGIAILCVMIGHAKGYPAWIGSFIYSFHMPLFFIVSGYFAKTYDEYAGNNWDFIRKNAKQLLLPYAIVAILSCLYPLVQACYYWDMSLITHKAISYLLALDFVYEGTVLDVCVAPIWFLLALFWARLFFYWLSRLGRWFIPLCVVLPFGMILIHPYVPTPFCIGRGLVGLAFMAVGWAYRKYSFPVWSKVLAVICWLASMCLGAMDLYLFRYNYVIINIIGACGGTYVIYLVSKGISKLSSFSNSLILSLPNSLLVWCGRNSLIILCAHTIELSTTMVHVLTKFLPFRLPVVVYYGIKHAITVLGSWFYVVCKAKWKTRSVTNV